MLNHKGRQNEEFINEDALNTDFSNSDFIICYHTIKFIRPSLRQIFIDKIYKELNWVGASHNVSYS